MARARNPQRDAAKKQWLDSGGKTTTKELAAAFGVPDHRIRKWRSEDKWQQALEAKRPGGQQGNRNAAGHGAPKGNNNAAGHGAPIGNNNAETHGAYSTVHLDSLPANEREYIESLTLNARESMTRELQILYAKERDLIRKIKEYEAANPDTLYIDKVVEMLVPKGKDESGKRKPGLSTAMKTVIKASPFDRAMKLEAEYNKIHGRILKLIDSIRAHEVDTQRLDLDERKHTLAKQRLTGEYDIDPDTGELNDREGAEDETPEENT